MIFLLLGKISLRSHPKFLRVCIPCVSHKCVHFCYNMWIKTPHIIVKIFSISHRNKILLYRSAMYTLSFSKITQNVIYLFPEIDSSVHHEFVIYTCIHSPPIILSPVNFYQNITICSNRTLTMSFSGTY